MTASTQRATVGLRLTASALLLLCSSALLEAQTSRRPLAFDDLARIGEVSDPAISPDGQWVAYVVKSADVKEDRRQSDVWMVRWDDARTVRLTHTPDASERAPRWSPDGRWLAFLSSRGDTNEAAQLWLLDRLGGEAERVTTLEGGVDDYGWSPQLRPRPAGALRGLVRPVPPAGTQAGGRGDADDIAQVRHGTAKPSHPTTS